MCISQAKQIELQFTVGEAITSAAIGTSSVAARDAWIVAEEEYTAPLGRFGHRISNNIFQRLILVLGRIRGKKSFCF